MSFDRVWLNANLCTMQGGLGVIADGALAVRDRRIAWLGPRRDLPDTGAEQIDCGGAWMLPGLIDCHTHLVFAGDRAAEFEQRLEGATYEEIARAGGGILSTVRATRAADEDTLVALAAPRRDALAAEGVTTIEVKSGYGLDRDTELRMLRAARRLGGTAMSISTSLLALHATPPEFFARPDDYAGFVADEIVPASIGLADAVDAFSDRIAFTPEQADRVFAAARARGLPVRLHADQLCDYGGAALAARAGALSADHLEYANPAGLRAMADAGTVAVLLPGAFFFLREERRPDIDAMRAAGLRMAIATDLNPGSSPMPSLLLALNMACTLFCLTVTEALLGVTARAAAALGLADRGRLAVGLRADLSLHAIGRPAELCYWIGRNPCVGRVVAGQVIS